MSDEQKGESMGEVIPITDFERRQMAAVRLEIDQEYEAHNGLTKSLSANARHTRLSSTTQT